MELSERLKALCDIVESATPLLLEGYARVPGADPLRREHLGIQTKKSVKDLVTVFDQRVEAFLTAELARRFPGEAIVGEEAVAASGRSVRETCEQHDAFWIIDPIDGTTNYSRAYPFFCSTVAYIEKINGRYRPVVGLVWNPVTREMFSAALGQGAWLNRERLKVTQVVEPHQALLTTGFASERASSGNRAFDLFRDLTKMTLGVRRDGSAALDLAYVAAGRIDAYWEWGLSPWDTAAGLLLVEEAGGKVTHHDGGEIDLMTGEIVASNGSIHGWLVQEVGK